MCFMSYEDACVSIVVFRSNNSKIDPVCAFKCFKCFTLLVQHHFVLLLHMLKLIASVRYDPVT